jgi:predicted dehydrogenase
MNHRPQGRGRRVTWRWGIVGPGAIAVRFAEAMSLVDGGVLAAVASRSQDRADAFGERFGIPRRYGDVRGLLDDADVDVVYVATPHARHAADTIAALGAGKHVLCEKPLALSSRQARDMVTAARAKRLFLMEAISSRFLPAYAVLRDVVGTGRVGEPLVVEADFGFRSPVMPGHRLFDLALGGGAILDLGIYPVQLCSMILGPADRVSADGVVGATGVDELFAAVLHHPGGRLGVVKAALRAGLACTARISCSDGWIDVPKYMQAPQHVEVGGTGGIERIECGFGPSALRCEIDEVHDCLTSGRTESAGLSLDESISLACTLDAVRSQLGVVYPGE